MRQTEIKVGLFVIIAGVIAVAASVWLSRVRWGGTFDIVFNEVSGLEKGVPVRFGGVPIGTVTDVFIEEVPSPPASGTAEPAAGEGLPPSPTPPLASPPEAGGEGEGAGPPAEEPAQPRAQVVVRVTLSDRSIALLKPDQALSKRPDQKYLYTGYRYLIAGGSLLGTKYIAISQRDLLGRTIPVKDEQILCRGGRVKGEDPIVLEDVLARVSAIAQSVSTALDEATTARMREAIVDLAGTAQEVHQLMQKVNLATGESGERLVRIVSNVERVTGDLSRLLADNQTQVRRMLAHLSSASGRFDRILQQSGPDLRSLTRSLATTSASIQRVVTTNEANFNRLTRDLTGTTETLQRMLRDNEQEVHRMLTSLADTSEVVQRTLSQNEGKFGAMVDNLTTLTTDLRQTLAGSQKDLQSLAQNLASISGTVQEVTQGVQDELQRTAAHLDQLTGHVNELVAGNKDNVSQILVELNQLSKNLTVVSGRLQTFLENDQWATDLQQSLTALRATSEDAAATMESLRGLLTDPELQGSVRGTVQNLEQATAQGQRVLEKANRLLGGDLASRWGQPHLRVDLRYRPETEHFRTDVNLRLPQKDGSFWQVGWEDATEGNRFNLQYGVPIRPRQTIRAGLYRSKLGVGWEHDFGGEGNVEVDLFDPNETQLNLRTHYHFHRDWQLSLGVESLGQDNDFIWGVRYAPGGD